MVISFIIKRYTRVNIFRHIKETPGKDIVCVARKLEDLINKDTKIQLDTNSLKIVKRKDLMPTFAKVNVVVKHDTQMLKIKIVCTVMETEIKKNMIKRRRLIKKFVITSYHEIIVKLNSL